MKATFLVSELNKWLALYDRRSNAFLDSVLADSLKREYLRLKVMPVIERDLEYQRQVIVNEAERLLKEKENEKWKNKATEA